MLEVAHCRGLSERLRRLQAAALTSIYRFRPALGMQGESGSSLWIDWWSDDTLGEERTSGAVSRSMKTAGRVAT